MEEVLHAYIGKSASGLVCRVGVLNHLSDSAFDFNQITNLGILANRFKFQRYVHLPFRALHTDFFDEMGAPNLHLHDGDKVASWFQRYLFHDVKTFPTRGLGWRGSGSL